MAKENVQNEVGDPCVYWLRIDLNMFDRTPKDCDQLAQIIAQSIIRNFITKKVSFCNDVELKKMIGEEYQKIFDEAKKKIVRLFTYTAPESEAAK